MEDARQSMMDRLDRIEERQMAFSLYGLQKQGKLSEKMQKSQNWSVNINKRNERQISSAKSDVNHLRNEIIQAQQDSKAARRAKGSRCTPNTVPRTPPGQ